METFDGENLDSGDASNFLIKEETLTKILQVAHDISVISNSSEEKNLLLIQLKKLLDGDVCSELMHSIKILSVVSIALWYEWKLIKLHCCRLFRLFVNHT
jgi:hypothetical protein